MQALSAQSARPPKASGWIRGHLCRLKQRRGFKLRQGGSATVHEYNRSIAAGRTLEVHKHPRGRRNSKVLKKRYLVALLLSANEIWVCHVLQPFSEKNRGVLVTHPLS